MPLDSKRLPVPEESCDPSTYIPQSKLDARNANWSEARLKRDRRSTEQTRPIFLKSGVVSQAKGSAYIEMDKTKIICAVYGPREVTRRDDFSMQGLLTCEFKFATFSCATRRQHQQDPQEKEFSSLLQGALQPAVCLEKYPKAKVDVFVTVLQNDGAVLAGAISCASVALADAGIEMYDLVVGCSMRQLGEELLMDPTEDEEYDSYAVAKEEAVNNGTMTVGYMPSLHQMSAIAQTGELEAETSIQAMRTCISHCQKLYPVLQQCLVQAVHSKMKADKT